MGTIDHPKIVRRETINLFKDIRENILSKTNTLELSMGLSFIEAKLESTEEKKLIDAFIQFMLPIEKNIRERDDDYFMGSKSFFKSLIPEFYLNKLRELYNSDVVDEDDKDVIWEYVISILDFVADYKKSL